MEASAPEVVEEEDGDGNDDDDDDDDDDDNGDEMNENCGDDDEDNDDETQSGSDDNVDETPHANSDGAVRGQKVDESVDDVSNHSSSEGNGAIHAALAPVNDAAAQPKSLEAMMQLVKQRLKDRSCPLKQAEKKKNQINNHTKRCGYEALYYAFHTILFVYICIENVFFTITPLDSLYH